MSSHPNNMSAAPSEIESTPSAPNRKAIRKEVEERRRKREGKGFEKLRDAIQSVAPNIGSKFEKADILEQAANLLIELGTEKKKRKVKENKDTTSPISSIISPPSSIPSTPSSISSSLPSSTPFTPPSPPFVFTPPTPPSDVKKEEGEIDRNELPQAPTDLSLFSNPLLNQIFLANLAQAFSSMTTPPVSVKESLKRKAKDEPNSSPEKNKIWRAF